MNFAQRIQRELKQWGLAGLIVLLTLSADDAMDSRERST